MTGGARFGGGVWVRRYTTLEAMAADLGRSPCLAIGTFDGVHLGHRAVIRAMSAAARAAGAPAAVLTFTPHPLAVLRPDAVPPLLTDYPGRAALLEGLGIDALVQLTFTPALATVPAEAFVQDYLCHRAGARRAFVGADFTFGARAAGTAEMLAAVGRQACGLETTVIPLRLQGGVPISSTRIREALRAGRPGAAARLLGHPFTLAGPVVEGDQRGRLLGFPTANLVPDPVLAQPAPGVYAVRCRLAGGGPEPVAWWPAVANLGRRPTVGGVDTRLEVHLLDFDGDLYGRVLKVAFVRRLRGEQRFPDLEALRRQIGHDARRARQVLGVAAATRSLDGANP